MTPVVLIAANYVREQRWAVLLLLGWVVFSAVLISFGRLDPDDVLFFIKEQAVYGAAFSGFLAASAIHNDRRSRRILTVLSKGIHRGQYLAGLILGLMLIAALYGLALGLSGSLMYAAVGGVRTQLWYLVATLLAACLVVAASTVLFSTFLPPLLALTGTLAMLAMNAALARAGITEQVLPAYTLLRTITSYQFRGTHHHDWGSLLSALLQAAVLWAIAAWIFARRDIAVALE